MASGKLDLNTSDSFIFNENEVTRLGTEHVCVIDGKHFNFVTVSKDLKPDLLVYGEMTTSLPPVDEPYRLCIRIVAGLIKHNRNYFYTVLAVVIILSIIHICIIQRYFY